MKNMGRKKDLGTVLSLVILLGFADSKKNG
jgi:hypothetical protein